MDTENPETDIPIIQSKSSFKLWKNAKNNWQYEIKIYGDTIEQIQKDTETMRIWAETNYGGQNA